MLDLNRSEFRSAPRSLVWLAGLLEAEGTFLKPPPSGPTCPVISCRMTDRDVVDRVADLFGTGTVSIDKGRYRTEYATTVKGSRAVVLMKELQTLMGERRSAAIEAAIRDFSPPKRKLTYANAEQIRNRHRRGESVSSLSRDFGVARQTIHPILRNQIYLAPALTPWGETPGFLRRIDGLPDGTSLHEFLWLAGWLEGEGSFLAPPPSDPRRPRIQAVSRDRDVVYEAARLLDIKPLHRRDPRNPSWSPLWSVMKAGDRARTLMKALRSLMGQRRCAQIEFALQSSAEQVHAATA